MKGRRHSPEQVVRKLHEADRLLAEGAEVECVSALSLDPDLSAVAPRIHVLLRREGWQ
jgi:hypothetical protein